MEVKAGYKTTEFWFSSIVSVWAMFGGMVPEPYSALVVGAATGVYTIARSFAKAGILRGTVGKSLTQ